jgi:hypothetical protein
MDPSGPGLSIFEKLSALSELRKSLKVKCFQLRKAHILSIAYVCIVYSTVGFYVITCLSKFHRYVCWWICPGFSPSLQSHNMLIV